jgi:hypothetical protein
MDIFKNVETYEIDYGVNEINLSIVYNDKTLNLLNDPNFDFNIKVYNEFINKKIENTKLFNNNFSLEQLREVINKCSKNYFFKAGHKLLLDSKEYDESEANILYKTELEKIYNNQDSKDKFDSIKKQIKNAHTKDLSKYLDQNKHLLKYLPYRKMIETIILNQFKINENSKNEIEELINQLNSINLKIKSTVENERSL